MTILLAQFAVFRREKTNVRMIPQIWTSERYSQYGPTIWISSILYKTGHVCLGVTEDCDRMLSGFRPYPDALMDPARKKRCNPNS